MKRGLLLLFAIAGCVVSAQAITMDEALARTLERNPEIQQARHALEEASGRRTVLRSNGFPDLIIGVPAGVQGGERAGEKSVQPFAFALAAFRQPLFNASVPASRRRGDVEVLIAQQRLNLAVIEQLHGARSAFSTALFQRSLQGLRAAQRDQLAQNVAGQNTRYQAGNAARSVVTAADTLQRELGPQIEESRRAYEGAVLTLAQIMGEDLRGSGALFLPSGEITDVRFSADLKAETANAVRRRADLQLARLLVRAAEEDQRIIEAAYYPAVNASLSGNYIPVSDVRRGSEGSPHRSDDIISSEGRFGFGYTWRVVDNGKTGGAALHQRATREINELLYRKLEANVPRELARLHAMFQALEQRRSALASAVSSAEQNTALVRQNLEQGVSSQLEYRSAEAASLRIKSGLLTVAYEQNIARAEWDRATGRYLQFSDDTGERGR